MKPRILFVGRFPPPVHGAARMNELYFNSKVLNKEFNFKKIKINDSKSIEELGRLNIKKITGFIKIYIKLLNNIINFKPDLVYFEIAPRGVAFYRDSLLVLILKFFRKKIIFQLHAKGIKNSKNKFYYKLIFNNSKTIILSPLLYEDIKEIVSKEDVIIHPNGIPLISRHSYHVKKNKIPTLLFLSNMIESKGPLDVLKICKELSKNKINYICQFVGPFKDKKFKEKFNKKLEELKLEKNCQILGKKTGREKTKILGKATHFIFPTKYPEECFPLVILEALMFGIPVFSYDNGAIREIIKEDYQGYISKNSSWKELADILKIRLNKKESPKKIKKYFKENFSFQIAEKKFKKILKDLS